MTQMWEGDVNCSSTTQPKKTKHKNKHNSKNTLHFTSQQNITQACTCKSHTRKTLPSLSLLSSDLASRATPLYGNMLQRGTHHLLPRVAGATARRRFSTDSPAEQMFIEAWKRVAPNIDPPNLPLSFMQPRPPVPGSIPAKLTLNFYLPYSSEVFDKEVDMVILPALTGQMGILPGHVATMTELKPGLLSVQEGNETTKYFVSGGFAFIHPNSVADIITVEAVPIDRIDPNLVQKGLAEFSRKLSSATGDYEKAEAQIGVDVHSALNSALTS